MLQIKPVTFAAACEFIDIHHRHHARPQGWKFGTSCWDDDVMVGVVMVGRPVARGNDDGHTLEVIRCCTDGTRNACSMLYAAAWRASHALGYSRLITYILESEHGSSLKAAGWTFARSVVGRSWSCPSRPRDDKHPTCDKELWVKEARPCSRNG